MGKAINAEGQVYGRLTALDNGRPRVLCICSCGQLKEINRNHLLAGNTLSCGCIRSEKVIEKNTTHGKSNTRLHSIWTNMKSRCYNKNVPCFIHYGGKGVKVSEDWLTFEGFLSNIPDGYYETLELDRIDSNGDYCKANCRWVDRSVQCFNKDTDFGGVTYCERDNLWRAKITKDGESFQKYFKSHSDALYWRLQKEMELYGEYLK